MEKVQTTLLLFGIPFVVILTFLLAREADWSALARGLVGVGDGWRFFPVGIAIGSFLGAFAYSGGGGNLNLAQSYYIKEKGFDMGKYSKGIRALLQGGGGSQRVDGQLFSPTAGNLGRWAGWWRLVTTEHRIVFWGIGLFAISMLATLSSATARGVESVGGLNFFFLQGKNIAEATHPFIGSLFMIVGALMLFTTQLGVIESATRITAENVLLFKHKTTDDVPSSRTFYYFLWLEIALGVLYLTFISSEPRALLTLGAILNAAAMMVAFPLILILNRKSLPAEIRPPIARQVMLVVAFLFFLYFVYLTASSAQWR